MADLINSGNKKDKWTKRVTDLLNWLNEKKQATLVEGDNVTLTPQQDGTVEISAGGGAVALDDLTDVDVSSVTDGQALVYDEQNQEWVAGEAGQVDDVKVNGTSVVSNKIAEITSYKEVTQAEYDALTEAQKMNGIAYFIKDALLPSRSAIYAPVIYSTNERMIGVWIDSKPLYQKTVHINALPSSIFTTINYAHNIANIDTLVSYDSRFEFSSGSIHVNDRATLYNEWIIKPINDSNNRSFSDVLSNIACDVDKTNIKINVGSDRSNVSADVTIRYTKTTDVAGSGNWGADGIPMVHYSNDEHIIGTWIDGSTLYERTLKLNLPSTISDRNWFTINTGLSGIMAIEYTAILMDSNNRAVAWSPRFVTNTVSSVTPNQPLNTTQTFNVQFATSQIAIQLGTNITNGSYIALTVRYTKTT